MYAEYACSGFYAVTIHMEPPYAQFFPKPSFYPNQREAMDKIYQALSDGRLVLFEGACGTGKTLSALAPSLAFAREKGKKVVIATNVHQQMEQFIQEAREIKEIANIKVAVLKGKEHMCPIEKDYDECNVLKENTFELMGLERDLVTLKDKDRMAAGKVREDPSFGDLRQALAGEIIDGEGRANVLRKRTCPYMREVLLHDTGSFGEWLYKGVRSPEDISSESLKKGQCGYELLKRYLKDAELIICNYHHLLDPDIRARVLGWLGVPLEDVIIIFDEAHNLEAQARQHSSMTLSEQAVARALNESSTIKSPMRDNIQYFLMLLQNTVRTAYESHMSFGDVERLSPSWMDITIREPYDRDDMLTQKLQHELAAHGMDTKATLEEMVDMGLRIDEAYKKEFKEGKSETRHRSALLDVGAFMLSYFAHSRDVDYYPVLNIRRSRDGEVYGRIELFNCIPTDVTKPIFDGAYSAVLMSATLKPFEMVRSTLGIEREAVEMSFGTTFPPERRRTLAVDVPPQFAKNRNVPNTVSTLTQLIEDIINASEGNVLIFFPSSGEARRYREKIHVEVPIFADEVGISAQDTKTEFFKHGDNGGKAVLISYLWGTLTEGVDYKFDRCRTVVIVGVGFPSLNDRMKAVQNAYDTKFGQNKGWDYGVLFPTIRRIRQACGRVVRSPMDYGMRILVDARYCREHAKSMGRLSVYRQFPEDEGNEFKDIKPEKVKFSMMNFFNDIREMDKKPVEQPVKKKKKTKA